jgi:NitT/TauT family transport system permease protein
MSLPAQGQTVLPSSRRRRYRPSLRRLQFRGLYVPALILLAWPLALRAGLLDRTLIPTPTQVWDAAVVWTTGEKISFAWYSGTWTEYVWTSAQRVFAGYVVAVAFGLFFGAIIGWYRLAYELLDPFLQWLRPIPVTAWLPIMTLFLGISDRAAIGLIALGAFFPVLINTSAGVQSTPRVLVRAALMLGTRPSKLILRVALPSALPQIVTGLRLGLGVAWVLVVVSEMVGVQGGLGFALWTAYQFSRLDIIICVMVTLGILGLATDRLLLLASRPVLRWTRGLTVET